MSGSKAHSYAVSAEQAEKARNYSRAAKLHRSARKHFRRVADSVAKEHDHQTLRALDLLVRFHGRRAKELSGDRPSESIGYSAPIPASGDDDSLLSVPNSESSSGAFNRTTTVGAPTLNTPSVSFSSATPQTLDSVVEQFNHLQQLEESLAGLRGSGSGNTSLRGMAESRVLLGESFCLVGRDSATPITGGAVHLHDKELSGSVSRANTDALGDSDRTQRTVLVDAVATRAAQQQEEIGRLLQTVQRLTLENESLVKSRDRYARQLKEQRESTLRFREEYEKRFALLKRAMEQFKRNENGQSRRNGSPGDRRTSTLSMKACCAATSPNSHDDITLTMLKDQVKELQQQQRHMVERLRNEAAGKKSAEMRSRKYKREVEEFKRYFEKLKATALSNRKAQTEGGEKART